MRMCVYACVRACVCVSLMLTVIEDGLPSLADAILIYTPTQQRSHAAHTYTHTDIYTHIHIYTYVCTYPHIPTHTKICNDTQRILFVPLLCTDRFLCVLSLSLSLFFSLFLSFSLSLSPLSLPGRFESSQAWQAQACHHDHTYLRLS